jgi:hypothetical protein
MRLRTLAVFISSLVCSACHIGTTAASYTPATKPEGAQMLIATPRAHLAGELVEVRDNGIVVLLSDGRVALVPWSVTTTAAAQGVPGLRASYGGQQPSAEVRTNLVTVSHFPQGMTPDIQARFLAAHKQSEIVVIQ